MSPNKSETDRLPACPSLLIIEDDVELALGLESYFSHMGYQVEIVSRGDKALEAIRTVDPDILLLDWRLPKKTGVEVLREVRAEGIDTPVIMVSVHPESRVRRRDGIPRADDYIPKPFDLEDLRERMAALLT